MHTHIHHSGQPVSQMLVFDPMFCTASLQKHKFCSAPHIFRVDQGCIYMPYTTVYLKNPLQFYRKCIVYIWFWPTLHTLHAFPCKCSLWNTNRVQFTLVVHVCMSYMLYACLWGWERPVNYSKHNALTRGLFPAKAGLQKFEQKALLTPSIWHPWLVPNHLTQRERHKNTSATDALYMRSPAISCVIFCHILCYPAVSCITRV
jgi:hypothetical protein